MLSKDQILELLKTNDKAVARALVLLNNRQTADEQAIQGTRYLNGMGFRPCHARMGTSMATFYQRNGYLSPKQVSYWRATDKTGAMRIGLYWHQIQEEAEAKTKQVEAAAKAAGYEVIQAPLGKPVDIGGLPGGHIDTQVEQERLEYELGMVLDSDDPEMIGKAQADLDAFMAKVRGKI